MRNRFFGAKSAWLPTMLICWIFADTPSRNTSLRSTRLRGSGVTFHMLPSCVTYAIVKSSRPFFDIEQRGAIRISPTRTPDASRFCLSMSSFTDLFPEKVMLAMVGPLLYLNQGIAPSRRTRTSSKLPVNRANGVTDIFIINRVACVRTGILREPHQRRLAAERLRK